MSGLIETWVREVRENGSSPANLFSLFWTFREQWGGRPSIRSDAGPVCKGGSFVVTERLPSIAIALIPKAPRSSAVTGFQRSGHAHSHAPLSTSKRKISMKRVR